MSLIPIPAGRSPNLLVSQRMLAQLQGDQNALLQVQSQLSTGKRLSVPSDDYPAALRGLMLKRSLQQADQTKINLAAAESYLSASDSAIANVSGLLSDVRGTTLGVIGTTATDSQRAAAAAEVQQALEQMLSIGNQQFRDRYLFAGSLLGGAPFAQVSQFISYEGNEQSLPTIGGLDLAVATNRTGQDVFGALSAEVRGTADLNPIVTEATRLADLNGGLGVRRGSIALSDGVNRSVVDLSGAETVGDVVRRIQANPPVGREVRVRVTATGLEVTLVDGVGDGFTIKDVNGGSAAADLGILEASGSLSGTVAGGDLNPRLTLTTQLANVLGTRARTVIESAGGDNDLVIEARQNGPLANGLVVQFVDDDLLVATPGIPAGQEYVQYQATATQARASLRLSGLGNDLLLTANAAGTAANDIRIELEVGGNLGDAATATYDSGSRTLRLAIDDSGETTVASLAAAIDGQGLFTATADPSAGESYNPAATVSAADAGVASGDTGNSGAEANTLQIFIAAGSSNAADVVAAIEADATASAMVSVWVEGKDGGTPGDLGEGAVDVDATGALAGGSGIEFDQASGLRIRSGGTNYDISLAAAETVEDVLLALNGSAAGVLAAINESGTGLDVRSRLSGADFSIGELGGSTVTELGLRTFTRETLLADLQFGLGVQDGPGDDFTIRRNDGVLLGIDVAGATTIGDILDRVNLHVDNQDASAVTARLAAIGNGIELIDDAAGATTTLAVLKGPLSNATWDLGLVARPATEALATNSGGSELLTGADVHPYEAKGVFNTLKRLHRALVTNDQAGIARAMSLLDEDINRTTFARAELGLRQQHIDLLQNRWDDENIELQGRLSEELDVDSVEAILEMTNRQAAYQASLQVAAKTMQLTLLDFL